MEELRYLDTGILEFSAENATKARELARVKKMRKRVEKARSAIRVILCAGSGVFLFRYCHVFVQDPGVALKALGCAACILVIAESLDKAINTDK